MDGLKPSKMACQNSQDEYRHVSGVSILLILKFGNAKFMVSSRKTMLGYLILNLSLFNLYQ